MLRLAATRQQPHHRYVVSVRQSAVSFRMSSTAAGRASVPTEPARPASTPLILQYYLRQGIIRPEEAAQVRATLEAPLPACFRVNPTSPAAERVIQRLLHDFPVAFARHASSDTAIAPPKALSWFPSEHGAWQLDCGKTALAKGARENDALQSFRSFLLHHTAEGHLSRQEAVSMVPALLLAAQMHHRILDLCAAPGSKTAQLMEVLLAEALQKPEEPRRGFVVANDANEKRGYLLVHQLQRLGLDNAVVTCHDGRRFPGLYDAHSGQLQRVNVFDRVLCDVPCSGDGTIRKNRNLWGRWAPGNALTLHSMQLELALRAAALLRNDSDDADDALMTYSTCSLNPVENEAVVAELLRRADGALELVDCSKLLPGLVTRPGVTQWDVAWQARTAPGMPRADLQWFESYESVPSFLRGSRVLHSMFPPTDAVQREQLARCMRLFPTDQNTGGFFVALLRKVRGAVLPGDGQSGLESYEAAATARGERKPSRRAQKLAEQPGTGVVEPVQAPIETIRQTYTALREDHWTHIQGCYGLPANFSKENLYARSEGTASVSLVNPHIRVAALSGDQLKILDTGVRVFARVQAAGKLVFRPTEDGLERMLPFITRRKAPATRQDLLAIVQTSPDDGKQRTLGLERFSIELQEAAIAMREASGVGPMLMVLEDVLDGEQDKTTRSPKALPVWLGDKTLTLLVDKHTRERLAHASLE